jgi:hypothetical protein
MNYASVQTLAGPSGRTRSAGIAAPLALPVQLGRAQDAQRRQARHAGQLHVLERRVDPIRVRNPKCLVHARRRETVSARPGLAAFRHDSNLYCFRTDHVIKTARGRAHGCDACGRSRDVAGALFQLTRGAAETMTRHAGAYNTSI